MEEESMIVGCCLMLRGSYGCLKVWRICRGVTLTSRLCLRSASHSAVLRSSAARRVELPLTKLTPAAARRIPNYLLSLPTAMEATIKTYSGLRIASALEKPRIHPPLISHCQQHEAKSRQLHSRRLRRIAVVSASSRSQTAGERRIKLPSPLLPSYSRVGSCFAVAPPSNGTSSGQIKGIVAFFGGAFIGATPDAFYG